LSELTPLAQRAIALIRSIPKGKILTYSEASILIGAPGCSRHISYLLSSSSKKYDLPWHRVLNSKGKISLKIGAGFFKQKTLLENEEIEFIKDKISLEVYLWSPTKSEMKKILKGLPKHIPLSER
jgi:methylated-DNA-protein-cysteine methyltransferase-like protein